MKKMKKKGRVKWMKKKSDKMENIPDTMERITELEMSLKDYEHDKEVYNIMLAWQALMVHKTSSVAGWHISFQSYLKV